MLGALARDLESDGEDKVLPLEALRARVAGWRSRGLRVVFTNGCFDLLHVGHISLLEQARRMGDRLIVAVNSDRSVRGLKGRRRPLVREQDRAQILAALSAVDAVVIFDDATPLRLIEALRPDVLVKGGDYSEHEVVGAAEVKGWGGRLELVPLVAGHSTSALIERFERTRRGRSMSLMLLWVTLPTWIAIVWRKYLAAGPPTTRRGGSLRSMVIFRLDQLGDLVLTTPLFRELKRLYPGARCTVVVRPQYKALLTTNRNVDEILPLGEVKAEWLPSRARWLVSVLWFYWTELRHRQFDLAISPRWDVDESLATMLCALTNAGKRVGHSSQVPMAKRRINRGFDAAFDVMVPPGPLQHEVDRNLAIAEALGAKIRSRRPEIVLTESDRRFADELLKNHDGRRTLVGLGIGGRAAGRKWPLERYAECISLLNEQRPVQPVIVCSDDEDAEASALSVKLAVPPYILSGVPLRTVCAVLERCDLFLGNDTGTAHLAAAMNCPTVVVSRHPANGGPSHANSPAAFCAAMRTISRTATANGERRVRRVVPRAGAALHSASHSRTGSGCGDGTASPATAAASGCGRRRAVHRTVHAVSAMVLA